MKNKKNSWRVVKQYPSVDVLRRLQHESLFSLQDLENNSVPVSTNLPLKISKKLGKCYLQDDMSEDEYWGNWNKVDSSDEKHENKNEEIVINIVEKPRKIIETSPKKEIVNQIPRTAYIVGNKDLNIYPIHRNFYQEHPRVAALSFDDIESFLLKKNNIMVKELKTYPLDQSGKVDDDFDEDQIEVLSAASGTVKPIKSFEEMFWKHPDILDIIKLLKFDEPSPIQCIGWPVILSGRDFIGIAQTGTGKTLTFVLPALIHINGQIKPRQHRRGPTVLIVSPTRELAMQIESELQKFQYDQIKSVCCYGGVEKGNQIEELLKTPEIVVGTPGRINDLTSMGYLCLKDVSYLVLDEADRMLDMGFEPQVVSIINETRKHRQSIMTSATWPEYVQQIALLYMNNPIQVNVGSLDLIACNDVAQEVKFVNNSDKTNILCEIIVSMGEKDKLIVFVTRKIQCRSLTRYLNRLAKSGNLGPYAEVCEIHGDLSQEDREQSLLWFRNGQCTVLIATNVASRGLDIADITYVVNYDFPRDIEEYVHRVGRTGRAGKSDKSITFMNEAGSKHLHELRNILISKSGKSITFMNEADSKYSYDLRNILIKSNQEAPTWLLDLKYMKPNIGNSDFQFTPKRGGGMKQNHSLLNDSDYYYDNHDDFFDDYQRSCDPQMNNFHVNEESHVKNKENTTQETDATTQKSNIKIIEEKVIEYHADCVFDLSDHDETNFFDEYQTQLESSSPKQTHCPADYHDEMEYESDTNYEGWF